MIILLIYWCLKIKDIIPREFICTLDKDYKGGGEVCGVEDLGDGVWV